MRSLTWYLGWRYFFSGKGNRFVNWVSSVSIAGIMIGVVALIFTIAILNGFEREVTARITRFIPHVIIKSADLDPATLPQDVELESFYRHLERKAILDNGINQNVAQVMAPDLEFWDRMGSDDPSVFLGDGRLTRLSDDQLPGIVIGAGLSDRLLVSIGDTLRVTSPLDVRRGSMRVPQRHFVVTGVFRSDIFDYDRTIAIIPFKEGQRLFRMAGGTETHIRLKDYRQAQNLQTKMQVKLPDIEVLTWYEQHQTLFDAMQLEKWGSFIGLNLIILVAVFNIVSTLIMLVMDKTAEIGILRVLGMTADKVRDMFLIQGLLVAIIGVFLGTLLGTGLYLSQAQWEWIRLPAHIYLIPALPVELAVWEVTLIAGVAFVIIMVAVRYPARRAAQLIPIEAINYKK